MVHDKVSRAEHESQYQLSGRNGKKLLLKHLETNVDGQDAKWICRKRDFWNVCLLVTDCSWRQKLETYELHLNLQRLEASFRWMQSMSSRSQSSIFGTPSIMEAIITLKTALALIYFKSIVIRKQSANDNFSNFRFVWFLLSLPRRIGHRP